jgi:ABC-type uncharacterized transport system ATPase subunit
MKATGFGKNIVNDVKMDNAIDANGLTKYYGDFLAVDHISFEVKKGEIFGFLGPNGAGKDNDNSTAYGSNKTNFRVPNSCWQRCNSRD